MLDHLVESNDHSRENKRRGGFLLSTFFVVGTVLLSGILWSLFAKDLGLNAGNLEMSALIAPLAIAEEQPPPPEKQLVKSKPAAPVADVRTKIIQNINETPKKTPDTISSEKSNVPPRNPNHLTVLGADNTTSSNSVAADYRNAVNPNGIGNSIGNSVGKSDGDPNAAAVIAPKIPPPPAFKKEAVKIPSNLKKSLGVINGKAINLVKPQYSAAAKLIRADGAVNVEVTIDEKGNVIAAKAISGHPLLRPAAESAARASKFDPTTLSREPVKVSGIIVYNFTLQ
ncbi:MAG: energy transducer TonB [Acidobacteriota bacterium]|nr:energy transducer TonB [Acidobacteriota bacterium]